MFIAPMLPESANRPFSDDSYVFEPKMDGHRIILSKQDQETRLWTRHQSECTRQYPELHHLPIRAKNVVLDGEVCCMDPESGTNSFELVMERSQLKKKDKIISFSKHRPAIFMVWDILSVDGRDVRGLPLVKRRSILESTVEPNEYIGIVPQIEGSGEELWEEMIGDSMEGMVAKRKNSQYLSKRSKEWLAIINYQFAEVYLAGFRKDKFGWLAHAEENGKLRPAGMIELGVTLNQRQAIDKVIQSLKTAEDEKFVYIEPQIKAKVKYKSWTRNGMLRKPEFVEFML